MMKRFLLGLGALGLAACVGTSMASPPPTFSNASYSGGYGYHGLDNYQVLGVVSADGMGHSVDTRTLLQDVQSEVRNYHCTYQIASNGTGDETCIDDADQSMSTSKLVLAAGGAEIYRAAVLVEIGGSQGNAMLIGKQQ